MSAPEPLTVYTLPEIAARWEQMATRYATRDDETMLETGMEVALRGCAAELRAVIASARNERDFLTDLEAEVSAAGLGSPGLTLGPASLGVLGHLTERAVMRTSGVPLGTCDRLPSIAHVQLFDTDEALGCIEWREVDEP